MKPQGKPLPDVSYLNTRLRYEDGVLYWKRRDGDNREVNSWNGKHADKPAGSYDHKGYVVVRLDGSTYKAHRIIYLIQHGELAAELDVDHIDNDASNNRIENLRAVTAEFNGSRKRNQWGTRGIQASPVSYREAIA